MPPLLQRRDLSRNQRGILQLNRQQQHDAPGPSGYGDVKCPAATSQSTPTSRNAKPTISRRASEKRRIKEGGQAAGLGQGEQRRRRRQEAWGIRKGQAHWASRGAQGWTAWRKGSSLQTSSNSLGIGKKGGGYP
jgi:hypothetical protein